MNPLVSILIPTYNQVAYVREAVLSAVQQDYEPLQVVVADDASTDGTRDILEEMAADYPDRLVLVLGDRNLGITGNCNRALARCEGEFIAMQGGDDVLLPGKIAAQVRWFREHPDGVLCYHDCEVFDSETGETICLYSAMATPHEGLGPRRIIRHMRLGAAASVMLKRSRMPDSGFDEMLPMVSDWKMQIDVLQGGGRYGCVTGTLARYRRHPRNSRKSFPTLYYRDCLCTLATVDSAFPQYLFETRKARSRIFGIMALDAIRMGRRKDGLSLAAASMRQGIFSWKFPMALAFLLMPRGLQQAVMRALRDRIKALRYLDA